MVVQQNNFPNDGMGHIVVIVGYDPVRGFKVKSSDENDGKVEWIPESRMTWFQSIVTEETYQAVTFDHSGVNGVPVSVQNGQTFYTNRNKVILTLQNAHQMETGEQLGTNFNRRPGILLNDFGFVLKFKEKSKWSDEFNVCSFQSMLVSLMANVIPRSLEGLDGDAFRQTMIKKQASYLDDLIQKLTGKTLFETEGWKRVMGCFRFMESFRLNPDHFELVTEKVIHPNSRGFNTFVKDLQNDPDCDVHPELANRSVNSSLRSYIVSN